MEQYQEQPHDTDYDSPWKEMLEQYFKECMQFFFPQVYAGIDWTRPHEFLDKELQQIVRDAELGRRIVDKLVKVWTLDGEQAWVAVHVEVQGQKETAFAKRMYVYNYRIFDRYNREVVSLAVLADDTPGWRPAQFGYARWGCSVNLTFPAVKVLDYADKEAQLEASNNPFAIVVLSHLKTRATRKDPEQRYQWKLRLFKSLYNRGYSRHDILELMRFIDWIMTLPPSLEKRLEADMTSYEEERRMQYVTSFERIGIEKGWQRGLREGQQKGRQEGILQNAREAVIEILQIRFERVPEALSQQVNTIQDLSLLKQLHRQAITIDSLDEFTTLLNQPYDGS